MFFNSMDLSFFTEDDGFSLLNPRLPLTGRNDDLPNIDLGIIVY